jgi:tetratricopeptide (TPR) repeat protein
VALTLNNLAISHLEQNRLEEASEYVQEAFRIRIEQLGENHTNTAISKFTMAKLMLKTNQPDSALSLYEDAYRTFRGSLSENHSFTAQSMLGIGTAYMQMHDMEKARNYFDEGYQKIIAVHDENSLEFALATILYAPFLIETGEQPKATKILETAFETFQLIEEQESERQKTVVAMLEQIENEGT